MITVLVSLYRETLCQFAKVPVNGREVIIGDVMLEILIKLIMELVVVNALDPDTEPVRTPMALTPTPAVRRPLVRSTKPFVVPILTAVCPVISIPPPKL